jgi:hypothetical protein
MLCAVIFHRIRCKPRLYRSMYLFTTNLANYIEPVDFCIFVCHTRKFCCRVQIRLASMGETVFEFSHHHLSLSRSVCHIRRLSQQNEFQCRTVFVISPAHSAIQCDTVLYVCNKSCSQCDTVQCDTVLYVCNESCSQYSTVQCCISVISPAHNRVQCSTVRYSVVCLQQVLLTIQYSAIQCYMSVISPAHSALQCGVVCL